METIDMMPVLKKIGPVLLGTAAGYAYWYFIGCLNGTCPITSSWYTSTLYGGVVGATFLIPAKKKITPKSATSADLETTRDTDESERS